jgi:hypothetical protein
MGELQYVRILRWLFIRAKNIFHANGAKAIGLALLMIFLCAGNSSAQYIKLKTIKIPSTDFAALDRAGQLYLLSKETLTKYDSNGNGEYVAKLPALPSLFDPRDGAHLFAFWKENASYQFLLPDLQPAGERKALDSSLAIGPFLICPSGDHDLIVLDSADWSMKKISTSSNRVLYETIILDSTTSAGNIKYLREYQNFIFLLDHSKGIRIFNRMGKLLKTLPAKGISYFNFLGEEVYYPEKNGLRFFDLFTAEERFVPLPTSANFALVTDQRLFIVTATTLEIYSVDSK